MKKFLSAILISSLILSFAACGNKKSTEDVSKDETQVTSEDTASGEKTESEVEPTDEDIVIDVPVDESKTVYWATVDKDPSDVCYHKEDCEIIKDKTPDVLAWEIITTLGMLPCEECKPLD